MKETRKNIRKKGEEQNVTYRVPHYDVDISTESVVDMLCDVQVHKVTEMVVHIYPYNTQNTPLFRRNGGTRF